MKTGDRVRYVGVSRPDWHGIPATITHVSKDGCFIEVRFDREWTNTEFGGTTTGIRGIHIKPSQLEYLTVIDPAKPIRFKRDIDRPITLVGTMPSGDLVVTSTYATGAPWEYPVVFDKNTGAAKKVGCNLEIENAPVVTSGFYPLDTRNSTTGARGLISLDLAKHEYPNTKFYVEIISTDNVPTEAKIHAR